MNTKLNNKLRSKKSLSFSYFFQEWWWVVLFISVVLLTYDQIRKDIEVEYQNLKNKLVLIETQKNQAVEEHADLQLSIQSQTDPEWIKLTLKKRLGVVPEGQVKVHFKEEP